MSNYALFINGVYRNVLDDIRNAQDKEPDLILYLQPYAGSQIVQLAKDPPSSATPVTLFMSTTTELLKVSYACEVVGWNDKSQLDAQTFKSISQVIQTYQPTECGGIYMQGHPGGPEAKNLLHVRRMARLALPFGVEKLTKLSDGSPYSPHRTTAGGWSYVQNLDTDFLFERLHGYSRRDD